MSEEKSGLYRFTGLPDGFVAGFTTRRLAPDDVGSIHEKIISGSLERLAENLKA